MKRIEAVIKPSKLEAVNGRLEKIGVQGLTMAEVKGYGGQPDHGETYRGAPYVVEFVPKVLLTMLVDENQVEGVINAIVLTARTGHVGDGWIFVYPLDDVVRIRTNERGVPAL